MKKLLLTERQVKLRKNRQRKADAARLRKWRLENPDKVAAYLKLNRKKLNAQQKEWALKNPEQNNKWAKAHPELRREYLKAWRLANPERASFLDWKQGVKRRKKADALKRAAPELLAALRALLVVADHPNNPLATGACSSIIEQARAAIAKAKGGN